MRRCDLNTRRRFLVVSNRLPITVERRREGLRVQPSDGGLVTALRPLLRQADTTWIGWTGTDYSPELQDSLSRHDLDGCSLVPVFLTPDEKSCFYYGCANEILWPLFHDLQSRCNFDPSYWDVYSQVNEKFADAVESSARHDDFVWVHDYHLMMLGEALRARDLPLRLAYFHHIPFPSPDIFEKLPWRNQILRGMLHFNTLGFQTVRDRLNFIASVRRCLRDVSVQRLGEQLLVRAEGLCAVAGTFPISIDFQEFAKAAETEDIVARAAGISRDLRIEKMILGVDRLDYTKGIPERLLAFRSFLRDHPELHGRVTLMQVVVPSREEIPRYRELKLEVERLVSQINGQFGATNWTPVTYLHRRISREELVALYCAADIALVTPLKDGMNLVAKEFCAARVDDRGVLVLSEFAGAARELGCGALLVNPYDVDGVAIALDRACKMSEREQRVRMQRMRRRVQRHDVYRWCEAFYSQAAPARLAAVKCRPVEVPPLARTYACAGD